MAEKKRRQSKKSSGSKALEPVKPMPPVLYAEGKVVEEPAREEKIREERIRPPFNIATYNPTAAKIMWLGVALFTVIIAILWGWSERQQIASYKWGQSSDSKLITNATNDWNQIFKQNEEQEQAQQATEAQLQAVLGRLTATPSSTPTTTLSSTPSSTTSTIPAASSTSSVKK